MRRNFNHLGTKLRQFVEDGRGTFAVAFGVTSVVIMMGAGFALDTGQVLLTKSNLLNALDSAVTSTARDLTTGAIEEEDAHRNIEAFLFANGGTGFASADKITLDRIEVDRVKKTVSARASVDVALVFPFFGSDPVRHVSVESAAVYSDKKIEVAMMLDVTGSMAETRRNDKIGDLQTAAKNAVATFLDGVDPENPRVRVALVPYANSVNAGSLAESTVFVERSRRDRKQAPGMYEARSASYGSRPDSCATERKGAQQYTDAGPDVAMVNRDYFLDGFAGDDTCPQAAIVPLTADIRALDDTIDSFVAEGGTAGHIGIQWTWYMLSHNWAPVLKASQQPAVYDEKKVTKIAILMTDGEFNLSYFDIQRAGDAYDDNGKAATREAATTLCRAMQDEGIQVFTVGFQLSEPNAIDTMEVCASPDSGSVQHFYQAATGEELDAAFQEIAANVERLHLTK